jgi:hypothetical protein
MEFRSVRGRLWRITSLLTLPRARQLDRRCRTETPAHNPTATHHTNARRTTSEPRCKRLGAIYHITPEFIPLEHGGSSPP